MWYNDPDRASDVKERSQWPKGEKTGKDGYWRFIKLREDGRRYSTITSVRGVLRPAFELAVEDDMIRRNPFSFKITDVAPNGS